MVGGEEGGEEDGEEGGVVGGEEGGVVGGEEGDGKSITNRMKNRDNYVN